MLNMFFLILAVFWLYTPQAVIAAESVPSAHSVYPDDRDNKNVAVSRKSEDSENNQEVVASESIGATSTGVPPTTNQEENMHDSQPKENKAVLTPDPNRRWIMKQPKYTKTKTRPEPAKPVEWKHAVQKERCQAYGEKAKSVYQKARYYSIQGDRCKTARYSDEFLQIVEKSKSDCPDAFMENTGFDSLLIRNMQQLKALGLESCLGKTSLPPDPSSPPATSEK
jgi:hypothetical protein